MRCSVLSVSLFHENILLFLFSECITEAIQRITGALVGFMRPPYGSYDQEVLDVSGERGQGVAIWDFEFVYSSLVLIV